MKTTSIDHKRGDTFIVNCTRTDTDITDWTITSQIRDYEDVLVVDCDVTITDGTNHFASTSHTRVGTNNGTTHLALTAIVTVATTTNIIAQATTSSGNAASLLKAALPTNGSGNNATQLTALRIA